MKPSNNNFSKRTLRLQQPGRIDTEGIIYTYESHGISYDIAVIDGIKYYQMDDEGYSNLIDSIQDIHYEIERHYNI